MDTIRAATDTLAGSHPRAKNISPPHGSGASTGGGPPRRAGRGLRCPGVASHRSRISRFNAAIRALRISLLIWSIRAVRRAARRVARSSPVAKIGVTMCWPVRVSNRVLNPFAPRPRSRR